jgi:hypothetical protein
VVPLLSSVVSSKPASGVVPRKPRKPPKFKTTHLKPESKEPFESCLELYPKTFRRWDQDLREWIDDPIERGRRLPAEQNFQTIVDEGIADPYLLYFAFYAYITEAPKPKKGYFQHLSTFFGPVAGTFLEWLARGRELQIQAAQLQEA